MSDRPLAEDWWLASDGKWYPPQSRTQPAPPPPPDAATTTVQPVVRRYLAFGLTGTLMGFSIAAGALLALAGVLYFAMWGLWQDIQSGGTSTFVDLSDAANAADGALAFFFFLAIAVYILLIIWLNIAYKSAASRGAEGMAWSSGWAVGGWFIPVANIVIPKLVINEVDRMSQRDLVEPIGATWKSMSRTAVSDWWWVLLIVGYFIGSLGDNLAFENFDYLIMAALGYVIAGAGFILGGVTVYKIGLRLRS